MELTIALALSILGSVISVSTFVLNRRDKAIQSTKENHQELIEYQVKELKDDLKNIASDVKDVKKMLDQYKENFRMMVKSAIDEHVKVYHTKE